MAAKSSETTKTQAPTRRRPRWLRLLRWVVVLGLLGMLAGGALLAGMFYYYGADDKLPDVQSVLKYDPPRVTRVYDRSNVLLAEIAKQRRTVIPYSEIPDLMVRALVAAEDDRFFEHSGLDYWGVLRALYANIRAGRFVQGGSTLTQQLVKTLLLTPERTIRRKMQEVILARRIESELSKEQILHLYLNQVYFGHGRYGVQEAARYYFGRDVQKLGISEFAMLAGLPQSPARLSPFKHPKRAKRRQRYVLRRMAQKSFISKDVAARVAKEPIRLVRRRKGALGSAPELIDIVRKQLETAFGAKSLDRLGIDVRTTIDAKLQRHAREALEWGLRALDARQGYRKGRRLKGKRLKRFKAKLAKRGNAFKRGVSYRALVLEVDDDREEILVDVGPRRVRVSTASDRYNPNHALTSQRFRPNDQIKLRYLDDGFTLDQGPQGALVAINPQSGEVLAVVGGYDFKRGGYNRAVRARRQPGSSFKPFVYAAALDSERYTAATLIEDAPAVYKGWQPRNFDGQFRGPIRMRQGLTHSVNTIAVRLIDDVGIEKVRQLASSLGIQSPLGPDLSLALGSSAVTPLELAGAYCAFANQGKRITPRFIASIGKETVKTPESTQVLRPEVAYVLTSMLQSVVQEGTARRARRLRRPVAGKTGTTNQQRDAWFVGFSPNLVAAVWVGFDRPKPLGRRETGGRAALPIWLRFMKKALAGKPKLPFKQPANVTVQRIDSATGLLARGDGFGSLQEVFIAGTEPKTEAPSADVGGTDPGQLMMGGQIP